MVADFVKNREVKNLPEFIQKGIKLHRQIDSFTDAHPTIHEAKKIFSPQVRLYSGAFVDVSFDYFLANDFSLKNKDEWKIHAQKVYEILERNSEFLPENFRGVLQRMKKEDWLYNYRNDWGIEFSFRNVVGKAKYLENQIDVFPIFLENKDFLKQQYQKFFPEIRAFVEGLEL